MTNLKLVTSHKTDKINDKFKKQYASLIKRTARAWEIYSIIAPCLFVALAGLLLTFEFTTWKSILYSALTIAGCTVIMWWFWAIWSIRTISETMDTATQSLEQVRKELKLARKEMKQMPFDR